MRIGVPRELKPQETRVSLTPDAAHAIVGAGHEVLVETDAGEGAGFADDAYRTAGATIVTDPSEVWQADLVTKVKEPVAEEWPRMRAGQVLFTYLHLAASADVAKAVLDSGITAFAYETVQAKDGRLPLLSPMSAIAGRLATQVGAQFLTTPAGGSGTLLGRVPGADPANVAIVGAGIAGSHAADVAAGMGAHVTVLDIDANRLASFPATFEAVISTPETVALAVADADLVIGTVLVPGSKAPKLVTTDMVRAMRPGSVLVDVAIDQGGCFEGSRPTTHAEPTIRVHDSLFYCVTNMPAAVPRTATWALSAATLPYVLAIAGGWRDAVATDSTLAAGLNAHEGRVVHPAVAAALDLPVQAA
jgi:alanine dehydrogenase